MKYASTRGKAPAIGFSEAIERGLAPDGGLYVPERFPELTLPAARLSLTAIGEPLLQRYSEGDALAAKMGEICREALDFPVPDMPVTSTTERRVLISTVAPASGDGRYGRR